MGNQTTQRDSNFKMTVVSVLHINVHIHMRCMHTCGHSHVVILANNEHAFPLRKHSHACKSTCIWKTHWLPKHTRTHAFVYCVWCMHSLASVWVPSVHNGFLVSQRRLSSTVALINFQEKERGTGKVRSVKVWLETKPQPADYFILGTGPQRPPCIFIWRSAPPLLACSCQLGFSSPSVPLAFLRLLLS